MSRQTATPTTNKPTKSVTNRDEFGNLQSMLRAHYRAGRDLRRGVCLLNAGVYDEAAAAFQRAWDAGCAATPLPTYMAACLLGLNQPAEAAKYFAVREPEETGATTNVIRQALSRAEAGEAENAIQFLREAIAQDKESAELHYQLGTLLAARGDYDEAEARFGQAINIDPNHTESLVSLALCCGVRHATSDALRYLQRAQARRPQDARIGLLLAQAAKAVHQRGYRVAAQGTIPEDDPASDRRGIHELTRLVRAEPEFVEAFLALPETEVDGRVFEVLADVVGVLWDRAPGDPHLAHLLGRLHDRLGRWDDAIVCQENAVAIDAWFTKALIELGRLYLQTDRDEDAIARLEQAISAGADYPDVHYLLGNAYQARGEVKRAQMAYRTALALNENYADARRALEAIAV